MFVGDVFLYSEEQDVEERSGVIRTVRLLITSEATSACVKVVACVCVCEGCACVKVVACVCVCEKSNVHGHG